MNGFDPLLKIATAFSKKPGTFEGVLHINAGYTTIGMTIDEPERVEAVNEDGEEDDLAIVEGHLEKKSDSINGGHGHIEFWLGKVVHVMLLNKNAHF